MIFKLQEQKAAGERVELERKVKQQAELIKTLQEQLNSSRKRIEVLEAELDETEDKLIDSTMKLEEIDKHAPASSNLPRKFLSSVMYMYIVFLS